LPFVLLLAAYSPFLFLDYSEAKLLGKEDGFFETMGALFLLLSAIFFFMTYFKSRSGADIFLFRPKRNIFFLLLGLLFLFGFFEEISWGQRIFNIETPDYLKEVNDQEEINFHNLKIFSNGVDEDVKPGETRIWLNSNRIMTLFWFTFCCFVPGLFLVSSKVKNFLKRINLPIVPIYFGALFIMNYLLTKVVIFFTPADAIMVIGHSITEIKEACVEFLFALSALWFYKNNEKTDNFTNISQARI
jgi:hypothetical protein